jgi:2-polyprenyl-6-methoxyphenol hydroxylase-like FAD-dependent oxidoreductase
MAIEPSTQPASAAPPRPADAHTPDETLLDTLATSCCIVGGGPAGAMLALLLARQGVSVALLEEHLDFDRRFRGDTIHPAVMENLAEIGLADRMLQLPHTKLRTISVQTAARRLQVADFGWLKTPFPYVTLLPQKDFLTCITGEARRYPDFHLMMGARVERLIEEGDVVRGVRYRAADGWHEARATLTVAADGRFSRLRRLGGFTSTTTSPPMDVIWFELPREPDDPTDVAFHVGAGHLLVLLNRPHSWQVGYIIPKGSYQQLHAAGLPALRAEVASLAPDLADRLNTLQDWQQVFVLSVASDHVLRWYRQGLLLIGDAAHTMSPVGGVGINYAIQDAVVAANLLAAPLRAGYVELRDLAAVQRQREWPVRVIQWAQSIAQRRVLPGIFRSTGPIAIPGWVGFMLRLPGVRALPARLIGFGLWPAHVRAPKSRQG